MFRGKKKRRHPEKEKIFFPKKGERTGQPQKEKSFLPPWGKTLWKYRGQRKRRVRLVTKKKKNKQTEKHVVNPSCWKELEGDGQRKRGPRWGRGFFAKKKKAWGNSDGGWEKFGMEGGGGGSRD